MQVRILIADDDPLIREALEIIIKNEKDFLLAAVASDGKEAADICISREIDVAVLDIRMPVKNGVEAAGIICSRTQTKVLVLTTFDDDDLVKQAIDKGAKGYILKGAGVEEIKNAIRMIALGHNVFQDRVFKTIQQSAGKDKADLSDLSDREADIVKLISEGLSNREISERMFLSEGTVKNYINSILSKLHLKQRTQIAVYYLTGKKPGN